MSAQTQNHGLARVTAALAALAFYLQWGTGTGAAASANVVTTTSTTEARTTASVGQATTSVTNDTLTIAGTITELSTGPIAITEVGAFDAAGSSSPPTGGNMDYYGSFAAINVSAGDSIAFTMSIVYS